MLDDGNGDTFPSQPFMTLVLRPSGSLLDMSKRDQVGTLDGFFMFCAECSCQEMQMGS